MIIIFISVTVAVLVTMLSIRSDGASLFLVSCELALQNP